MRRWLIKLLVALLIVWVGLIVSPYRSTLLRAGIVASAAAAYAVLVVLLWKRRWVRYGLLALPVAALVVLILPGRGVDATRLRAAYGEALRGYDGTRYIWGGEDGRGIDCSGLVRVSLENACLREGVTTANPALVRAGVWFWWHDASASELARGYAGQTQPVTTAAGLGAIQGLRDGDFAVTADGTHTLAYAGAGTWVEADPIGLRVRTFSDRRLPAEWQTRAVGIYRWRLLAGEGGDGHPEGPHPAGAARPRPQ